RPAARHRHDPARETEAGVRSQIRPRDLGQQLAGHRRRGDAGGRERGRSRAPRAAGARGVARARLGGSGSARDGARARAGGGEAARAARPAHGRSGAARAERGLRRPGARLPGGLGQRGVRAHGARARAPARRRRSGAPQSRGRRHRLRPPGRRLGRAPGAASAQGARAQGRRPRGGGALHRRRAGRRGAAARGPGDGMSTIEGEARIDGLSARALRHWRVEFGRIDTTGRLVPAPAGQELALLTLDAAGQSTNALSREVMEELDRLLGEIERRALRGAIVRSAKASGFIVGADVHAFRAIAGAGEAAALARQGQAVLDRLAALPFPTVALIHGFCLGGGLELAAACTWRVARDEPATRLGLPEVRLGIHPGFAGTVRVPALIGSLPALDLMLTGRQVSARRARGLGLVDEVVPARHELEAAQSFIDRRPARRRPPWYHRLAGVAPVRPWVARLLERRTRRAGVRREHYPAPYRIIELWRRGASAAEEADSLGELLVGRTSRN